MNLTQIRQEIYKRCKLGATPATDVAEMVDSFINNRHRDLLTAKGMEKLRDGSQPFTLNANTATYAFPENIGVIKYITDPSRNHWKLDQKDLGWLRSTGRVTGFSGAPVAWIPLGLQAMQTQPLAQTRLYVVSTGTDTGNVSVQYTIASGAQYTQVVTLNSTSAVQVGTSNTIVSAEAMTLVSTANGTISLQTGAVAANTVLNTIAPGKTSTQYLGVQFYPTPSENVSFLVDFTRNVPDLEQGYDTPLLPLDYHRLLPLGARMDMYEFQEDLDRYQIASGQYEALKRRLMDAVTGGPDRQLIPGSQGGSIAPEGGTYPASGWKF
jgi:hypothetical protein